MKVFTFENDKFALFVDFVRKVGRLEGVFYKVFVDKIRVFAVLSSGQYCARIGDGYITASDVTTAFPDAVLLDCAVDLRNEDIETLL